MKNLLNPYGRYTFMVSITFLPDIYGSIWIYSSLFPLPEFPELKTINPVRAVVYGAAVQATILSDKTSEKTQPEDLLLNIVPLSLSISIKTAGHEHSYQA